MQKLTDLASSNQTFLIVSLAAFSFLTYTAIQATRATPSAIAATLITVCVLIVVGGSAAATIHRLHTGRRPFWTEPTTPAQRPRNLLSTALFATAAVAIGLL